MNPTKINNTEKSTEHTLVCISPSLSNAKIIKTAAKMAKAFGGSFTALYVQTPATEKLDDNAKARLQDNIRLAEKSGADITTVYGEEVPYQIAEFARISGVTKIVIGRSNAKRRHFWSKPTLTEKLTDIAPNLDIHIIPDVSIKPNYIEKPQSFFSRFVPYPKDLLITAIILAVASLLGMGFFSLGFTDANIITIYILGVLLTSLFTRGYACGIIGSFMSVALFNFFFTEPRLTFHAYDSGYPLTFAIMLFSAIITGTLASKMKSHAKLSAQTAFRTKVLLDTNQLLQKAHDDNELINITATQLMKLLNRTIVMYTVKDNTLTKGSVFAIQGHDDCTEFFGFEEEKAVDFVYKNKRQAGATTDKYNKAKYLYMPVYSNNLVYAVVGIHINKKPLDSFETSILLSILGECAMALDNNRNAKEKELAAVLAKNEQLRANLLRAISHDLRTPLTSISGNASHLLKNFDKLDEATRTQIFADIFDDSQWLISLVENLLSITKLEEGRMNFNMSIQLMDEVVDEALKHINRNSNEHNIKIDYKDELLLAKMDAKLIIQVIINLVDNAIKYTHKGSDITITAQNKDGCVLVSVADNGNGIPDNIKPHVFEMFYTGENKIVDSRRSLGLGLYLCKSIINAHGGEINLHDNVDGGCVFTFSLPSGEVNINE